jgi:mannan endo-1,4-beta-mannosidase
MTFWDGTAWVPEKSATPIQRGRRRTADLVATLVMVIGLAAYVLPFGGASAAGPSLHVSPEMGVPGAKITITGEGFGPKVPVQITWDGSATGMPRASANGRGSFRVSMKVPKAAVGSHTLGAVQKSSGAAAAIQATATFQVTAVVAPTPKPTAKPRAPKVEATPKPTPKATPTPEPTAAPTPKPTAEPTPEPTAAPTTAPSVTPTGEPTAAPTSSPAPTAPPVTGPGASGFVLRCGLGLCLDGQLYRFTGLNLYNANSRSNCWYTLGSGAALDSSLTAIGTGQEAFRAWFFQRLATTNGIRDWSAFDHTLAVASAHGQRIIVTLTNQWGDCENVSGDPVYKSESWYQSAYKSRVEAGMTATYREWVREVVTRYRDDPTVLAWQLINEGEARTSGSGACSSTAEASVHAWATDVSSLIKSIDTKHLVSLGTIGNGQCGTSSGTSYEDLHAISTIDLCEYHDYDHPSSPMPGDQWNGLAVRLAQCQERGKPMFVGEVGIKVGDGSSVSERATDLAAKFSARFAAGVVGELPWEWAASGENSGDGYSIGPDDPVLDVLRAY